MAGVYLSKKSRPPVIRCHCGGRLALDPLMEWMELMFLEDGWPFRAETVRSIFLNDGPDAVVGVCTGCGSVYSTPAQQAHHALRASSR